jgi:ankyrin repeat protein
MEDKATGQNVFSIYLMKKDIGRMKQLLMRGADVNYVNKITGLTPLHQAIEAKLNSKIVNFLIKAGGNPHMEDYNGKDCCDKA